MSETTKELRKLLQAIAEGYPVEGREDRFILVENPRFSPDNGSSPGLVLDTHEDNPADTIDALAARIKELEAVVRHASDFIAVNNHQGALDVIVEGRRALSAKGQHDS